MFEGQIIGHYRVLRRLGEGGMGVVCLGEDTRLGRRVAIKFANVAPDERRFRARFLREARALSALNHQHIATVYDYGETEGGRPYIVMELIEGRDLHDLISAGEMTVVRAVRIAADVAEALAEAHRRGIVHRDIKPSNVMLNARGEVKVLDFGLAKRVLPEQPGGASDPEAQTLPVTHTQSGVLVGTPLYLSPEQAAGAHVDGRSDIFALGAVLYECLAGRPPFPGANLIEICAAVMHVSPQPPSRLNPDVPRELDEVVLKALAKRPEERYQSADEFAAALLALDADAPGSAAAARTRPGAKPTAAGLRRTLPESLRRPRFSPAFVIAVLLALAGAWLGGRWLLGTAAHAPPAEARHWYEIGEGALRDGTYYQARKAFEMALGSDPKFALAHARLAEAFLELDSRERAADELLQAHSLIGDRSSLPQGERLYVEAVTDTASSDYAHAVEKYQEIARLSPDKPEAYVDLGRAYEKSNDAKNATANYEKAAQLDPQYATAYLRLGMLYGRQGQQKESDDAFAKAEQIYEAQGNVEGRAEVHYQRGFLLLSHKAVAEAHKELDQSRELAHAAGNETLEALSLLQLSFARIAEGDTGEAQRLANEAVETARRNNLQTLAVRGLVDLGNALFTRGDLTDARRYFEDSLSSALAEKDTRSEARARFSLGSLQLTSGETDEGLANVSKALDFYQKGGYRNETANALILVGRARRDKGDYAAALAADGERLRLAEQSNSDPAAADAHTEIGRVLLIQEKYPQALEHFRAAGDIYERLGNQKSLGYNLLNRGDALCQLGRYAEADAAYSQASAVAGRAGNLDSLLVAVHLSRAQTALSRRLAAGVRTDVQEAQRLADRKDVETQIEADRLLGLSASRGGDAREAVRLCSSSLDRAKGVGNQPLLISAQLALAESQLAAGDAQQARALALEAQPALARSEQHDSEWRAWLLAARAALAAGDRDEARDYAARADAIASDFERQLSAAGFPDYASRPDVRELRAQLDGLLAKLK